MSSECDLPTREQIEAENRARADKLEAASVDAAAEGLKALLLLNGGACIALLAFLGATMGNDDLRWSEQRVVIGAVQSLVYFAAAAGAAVTTSIFSYLSNQSYSSHLRDPAYYKRSWTVGQWLNNAGLATALLSLGLFAFGVYSIWKTVV